VKSEGLDDLVHVVKPGGLVCFSIRDLSLNAPQSGYREKMDQFCEVGKWKSVAKHHEAAYLAGDGAWFFVYQKVENCLRRHMSRTTLLIMHIGCSVVRYCNNLI
jgi:hypothetical protein